MKYQQGLIIKNLKKLKKTQWYRQRFDACPHFLAIGVIAESLKEKRKMGCHFNSHLGFYEKRTCDWYLDMIDLKKVAKRIINIALKTNNLSKKLIKSWVEDHKKWWSFCMMLNKINISKLSNEELKKLYQEYFEREKRFFSASSLIDGFALITDQLIQNKIKEFLKNEDLDKFQFKYFTILTAPVTQSFINEAELSLLEVVKKIKENELTRKLFLGKSVQEIIKKLPKFKNIWQSLLNHQKKFFWSKNNYIDNNILSTKHFIKEIKGVIVGNVDIKKEIKRIKLTPINNLKEKRKLLGKLKLPKLLKVLLEISEDFIYWQDQRKKMTFWSTHYGSLLIEEIGRRFGYSLDEIKYLISPEIISLFDDVKLFSPIECRKRMKKCLFYQLGDKYEIISGSEVDKTKKKIFVDKNSEQINDFRGLPASRGKIRGRVKIIKSAKECHKIQKGDILVAVMTRPDYIAGIKKAAAIVTDEGGVTCHAAIVSREMGVPCIIATKIATKVLKDGDLVDVNANHGVITIIKSLTNKRKFDKVIIIT
ncbi:MAG: hypothetical protein KGZ85_15190 [Ignavibacterium sp.]|nr:hypothetical protein [Ignavibacterium sp.]